MARRRAATALFCALALLAAAEPSPPRTDAGPRKPVFGWVEEGLILPERTAVKMKLDTGALTSSMDAREIERFERDGQRWVRFDVEVKDIDTDEIVKNRFERPIIEFVAVRGAAGVDHRVVVTMSICVGRRRYDGPFSLRNRNKMIYPILLGRKAIEQIGLVDVTRTFTVEPSCP